MPTTPTVPRTTLDRLARRTLGSRLTRGGRSAIAPVVRDPLGQLTTPAPVNELVLAVLARQETAPGGTADCRPLAPRVPFDVRGLPGSGGLLRPAGPAPGSRAVPRPAGRPVLAPAAPITPARGGAGTGYPLHRPGRPPREDTGSVTARRSALSTAAGTAAIRPSSPLPAEVLRALCVRRSPRHAATTDTAGTGSAPPPPVPRVSAADDAAGFEREPGSRDFSSAAMRLTARPAGREVTPSPAGSAPGAASGGPGGRSPSEPALRSSSGTAPRGLADLVAMFATPPGDRQIDGAPVRATRHGHDADSAADAGGAVRDGRPISAGFAPSLAPRPIGDLAAATDVIEAVLLREARRFGVEVTDP